MKPIIFLLAVFYSAIILADEPLKFETKVIKETNEAPKYSIEVNYPQIKNAKLNSSEYQFNLVAKKWALDAIRSFQNSVKKEDTKSLPPEIKANGSALSITYDLSTIEPHQFVSLRYLSYMYHMGAAHPTHTYQSINYDLSQNKQIFLSDIFNSNSNYLQHIATLCKQRLKPKLNEQMFEDGLTPNLKNFEVWNITRKGIQFTFNEYQVAAYVFGPQEVTLTYDDLKQVLARNSTVYKCFSSHNCNITVVPIPMRTTSQV